MDFKKEYERIKKYAKNASDKNSRYDLTTYDMIAIHDSGADAFDMIFIAFNYGFEKGCRATKKAMSKNQTDNKQVFSVL